MTGVELVHAAAAGPRVVPYAVNTRDLGGLRGPGGLRVRPGLFYRGSAAAIGPLAARCGLRTVLDLRQESELAGSPRPAGPHVVARPVVADRTVIKTSARPRPSDYLAYYRRMVPVAAPVAAELLAILAEPARLPVLVCCSVGKDRTSVVCALALSALGVRLADLARDHALTARLLRRDVPAARTIACLQKLGDREFAVRTSVVGWTIGRPLAEVEQAHGSTAGMLAGYGLAPSTVAAARDVLLGGWSLMGFDDFRRTVVRERFERIADSYDDTIVRRRAAYNDAVDRIVAERAPRPADRSARLLDAACGTGTRWAHLHTLLPEVKAWGLDASENMCALARQRGDFVTVSHADLTGIPFPDGRFDIVTCLFFSFCYLTARPARLAALAEMRRVLRPGGLLVVDVVNAWHLGEGLDYRRSRLGVGWDALRSWLDPRLRPGDKLYRTPYGQGRLRGYVHAFSGRGFRSLLRAANFTDVHLLTVGYNSGRIHRDPRKGQLLALVRR